MKVTLAAFALWAAFWPSHVFAAGPLQRYTLVVGANSGGADRPQLLYAVSDAQRFARVMVDLGGVTVANQIVLRQPSLRSLTDALDELTRRVTAGRVAGGRTEVIIYYSGHADEKGLLLGEDRYSYRTLRDRIDQIPADVRIAVLDACASGAFTRIKSGKARPAFVVDQSSDMRGHAFLTSSSESEAAQESDRIRASYFTHYLVSGFRGAADVSGDGKVTLNEAYQFAFNETLGRTVDTKAGAQHPSYDISLSGTGDVIMTDVRQTTSTLVLGEELEGRFFVRTASQELVVELYKRRGRRVELAIEPGTYQVRLEHDKKALTARTQIAEGMHVALDPQQFGAAAIAEVTRRRGDSADKPPGPPFAVTGRNRVAFRSGLWRTGGTSIGTTTGSDVLDVFGGFEYTRYVREDLAVSVRFDWLGVKSGETLRPDGLQAVDGGILAMPVSLRWNPLKGDHRTQSLKPFMSFGFGPYIGSNQRSTGNITRATLGGNVSGGFDVHLRRSLSLGVDIGYTATLKFSEPVGLRDHYKGIQTALRVGWLFGDGYGVSVR